MAKIKRKSYQRLDKRIAAWKATCNDKNVNPAAYRKPGSMKK